MAYDYGRIHQARYRVQSAKWQQGRDWAVRRAPAYFACTNPFEVDDWTPEGQPIPPKPDWLEGCEAGHEELQQVRALNDRERVAYSLGFRGLGR